MFSRNKIAKAVALALLASVPSLASAQSVIKLYGLIDAWGGQEKTIPGSKTVIESGGMATSFWGIGGEEDLGGGLKAVFAIESFLRGDTGASGRFNGDPFFSRSAYVGLGGGFGQVTLGRNTNPYFLSTLIFNPFVDSFAFSPMILHTWFSNLNGDTGFSNSIRYQSPVMGGFKLDAIYTAGDENPSGSPLSKRNKGYDIGGFYFGGPLAASLVYRSLNLDNTGLTADQTALLGGVSYAFSAVKLFGQFQQTKLTQSTTGETKQRTVQLGVSAPVGPGNILASVASTKITDNDVTTADKRVAFALGYDYDLSKRTDLYAVLMDDKYKNPETAKTRRIAFGIRHRF